MCWQNSHGTSHVNPVNPVYHIGNTTVKEQAVNDPLTEAVIGAAYRVHNRLGFGFLESVYEKAMAIELRKLGLAHLCQHPIKVFYEGEIVGDFYADLFVDNRLLVELKSSQAIAKEHEVQLVNYLVATKTDVGLLMNFGPKGVEVRRKYREFKRQ